jgi:ubiquinone/menaquinone biosynthesis C-methylase UbiE
MVVGNSARERKWYSEAMTQSMAPAWRYDEFRHRGVDYARADEAAEYARKRPPADEAALCSRLGVGPGRVVVDLGCGNGSFALEAARLGATVHAVDVSQAMLDVVRRQAGAKGLRNLAFHHAGFLSFCPAPASIDVVVARFSLHHLPDFWKAVALDSIGRMLAPGGVFYLHDIVFSFDSVDHQQAIPTWIDELTRTGAFQRAECDAHVREEYSTFTWILEGLCERASFALQSRTCSQGIYAEYLWSRA